MLGDAAKSSKQTSSPTTTLHVQRPPTNRLPPGLPSQLPPNPNPLLHHLAQRPRVKLLVFNVHIRYKGNRIQTPILDKTQLTLRLTLRVVSGRQCHDAVGGGELV